MSNHLKLALQPIHWREFAKNWPALQKWNIEWFYQQYGNKMVGINSGKYIRSPKYPTFAYSLEKTGRLLGDYLNAIRKHKDPGGYLAAHSFTDEFSVLLSDIHLQSMTHEKLESRHFWISAPGTVTQLHFDRAKNILIQIFGTKQVFLYEPERLLKPMRILNNWAVDVSELEVDDICNHLPKTEYEYQLKPGDALYIPYGWWHKVISLDACASVNQWWWDRRMLVHKFHDFVTARLKTAFKN